MKRLLLILVLAMATALLPAPLLAQVQNPNVNIRAVGGTAIGTSVPVTVSGTAGSTIGISACSGATCYTSGVNSGITTIASGSTSTLFASTTAVQSIWCANMTGSTVNLTITDGNNAYYVGPNFPFTANNNGALMNVTTGVIMAGGVRASAGTASAINCQVEGMQ